VPDLWSALGYDAVAADVAQALQRSSDIIVLEGPPGVGKSWLAKGIGAIWQERGGSTIIAEGDSFRSDVEFYAFGFTMARLSNGWKSVVPTVAGIAKAGEALIGTAGIITATIEMIARIRQSRRRARTLFLGDAEQDILHELEHLSRKRPMLLIADNLHWWDSRSLEFVRRLRDQKISAAFPFVADIRVLAVQTIEPYQTVAHAAAHDALLTPSSTTFIDLPRIPRRGFASILEALGASPKPTSDLANIVYDFCGGHLALASRCAARIAEGEAEMFVSASDTEDFVRRLVSERIRSLGVVGREAIAVLQVAAVLGLTFSRDELVCASGIDKTEASRLLRSCRDEDLLELSDRLGRFVHDLYRDHFLTAFDADSTSVHERLSDCLRLLRPAEYELRALNAIDAEREGEAAVLGAQAAFARQREGRTWRNLPPTVLDAITRAGLTSLVESFAVALKHLDSSRHADCLETLATLPRGLPKALLAEADYLRAVCLLVTQSEADRTEARSILDSWCGYEVEEPEVGARLLHLLLYGLSLLMDKEPGRRLEGRIKQFLVQRVSFDAAAEDAMYTLDRCSGSLYEPEVSVIRRQEAAEHFGPHEGQSVLRRPIEYYRCLVNLGAGLLTTARYAEARAVYARIDELVNSYAPGVFPRLDYPRMNSLLAEYRLGLLDAGEAAQRQREIVTLHGAPSDPFYGENALAVYLTLADAHRESLDIFERLQLELKGRRDPSPSLLYLIRANHCAARFVAGEIDSVAAEWHELDEVARRIPYPIGRFLVRRHELLESVIDNGLPISPQAFDECLIVSRPSEFGPLWDQLGRGFRMPEIEWWR
jgi:AAA ATPase domain